MQSALKATGRLRTSATAAATGFSELASSGPPLGRPKCASRMTLPPLSAISAMVGATRSISRRIGHAAVLRRNVEVDAQENAFSRDIGVVEGAERLCHGTSQSVGRQRSVPVLSCPREAGAQFSRARSSGGLRDTSLDPRFPAGVAVNPQISFAIATAVSAMRLEKPHSLSYQDSTRTKLPSMTLVWSRWKIEERSSPLKSLETLGWSV